MMYCDSSLIVTVLAPEQHSEVARRWLGEQEPSGLAISAWVGTEVASALAIKHRARMLSPQERHRAWAGWQGMFAVGLLPLDITSADFRRAEQLVNAATRGLRAGDALHLAIAERHRCALATLDKDLADAALAIGLQVPAILGES